MSFIIQLTDATFRLGDRLVFEKTTWKFARGEQWAVIGPNGSGKSLFADALRGHLPLVHGELNYGFRPPPVITPEQALGHVSFEKRKSELHERVVQSRWNTLEEPGAITVKEFLSYEQVMEVNPFEIQSNNSTAKTQFERRRRRAMELLQIAPFFDRTLLSLSNGETQRVQLVRALCHPVRMLILDEPFIGLDSATRKHLQGVLRRLVGAGLPLLILTTRPEELPQKISHIIELSGCRLLSSGRRGRHRTEKPSRSSSNFGKSKFKMRYIPGGSTSTVANPLIQLRNVTVRYGRSVILEDINWTVLTGESWAVLGPNGSGKTTLLSLLLGDNPQAYANDVRVFDKRRGSGESIWELKKRIGWVSPELHLHFNEAMTSSSVVASGFHDSVGLFERPTKLQQKAIASWLKRFQLAAFEQTPLFGLSVGLQRMVLLARALVKEPELLVLDEPCQSLDAPHRELFISTVDRLISSHSVTVLYVTHRLDELPRSIKRALQLLRGEPARLLRFR